MAEIYANMKIDTNIKIIMVFKQHTKRKRKHNNCNTHLQIQTKRTEKNTWYGLTQPIAKTSKCNICKDFIKIIEKHFPKHSILKISYSYSKNDINYLKKTHKKGNNYNTIETNWQCNCRDKWTCPLKRNCFKKPGLQGYGKDKQPKKILYRHNGGNFQIKNICSQNLVLKFTKKWKTKVLLHA